MVFMSLAETGGRADLLLPGAARVFQVSSARLCRTPFKFSCESHTSKARSSMAKTAARAGANPARHIYDAVEADYLLLAIFYVSVRSGKVISSRITKLYGEA